MIIDVTTATGVQALWKQERIVLYVAGRGNIKFYTDLEGSAASPIAIYTLDNSGNLYIDVTDYVRANPSVEHLYVIDTYDDTIYDTQVSVEGLINPSGVLIPSGGMYGFLMSPPSVMIEPLVNQRIRWEARVEDIDPDPNEYKVRYMSGGVQQTDTINSDTYPTYLVPNNAIDGCEVECAHKTSVLRFKPKSGCNIYAMVRWVSFTGVQRVHTFEVTKLKSDTASAYNLLPLDNEYIEIKGRVDGFTLRLDGLNRYDLWYYADIINSSKVEVLCGTSIGLPTSWERVQVVTKTITLPDGESGTNGKLEIQVNYKRYDAVAM